MARGAEPRAILMTGGVMALPPMGGLERSAAFTALHDAGLPCETADVTALLEAYDRWLDNAPLKAGQNDLWLYTRRYYRPGGENPLDGRVPVTTAISRPKESETLARHAGLLWRLGFTRRLDEKSASTSVEML